MRTFEVRRLRLDVASGAVTPVTGPEDPVQAPGAIACGEKASQLDIAYGGGHPRLVLTSVGSLMFSSSCDQFLFSFANQIYIGDVATGAFAWLAAGSSVEPDLH